MDRTRIVDQPWTIVDRAKHWNDKRLHTAETVVRNAVRLLEDAALLQTYQRYGTASTIATIAFEEAGKVALEYWGSSGDVAKIGKGWSFHIRKQAAAGCLLLAEVAKKAIDEHPARKGRSTFELGSPEEEADLREKLARLMATSRPARLMELIALHAVEKTKQIGFYADEWVIETGFKASEFSPAQCKEAIEEARSAVRLLRSADHLWIAETIYLTGPLQERLLAAGKAFSRNAGREGRAIESPSP
jgi:AbiV family abortive infection protein